MTGGKHITVKELNLKRFHTDRFHRAKPLIFKIRQITRPKSSYLLTFVGEHKNRMSSTIQMRHMRPSSKYGKFNSFDLESNWIPTTRPSGTTQHTRILYARTDAQGQTQGHPLIFLIWIKILETSRLGGFNHFDALIKNTSRSEVEFLVVGLKAGM